MIPFPRGALLGRTAFLQAAWNFEGMQNLGLALILDPWLKRLYAGRAEELKNARLRHLQGFSTQPHMAPMVAGMICGLEETVAGSPSVERPDRARRLMQLRGMTASALAGVGDALFWSALRPFCAALGLAVAALLWSSGPGRAAAAGTVVFLAAFNAPGLALRAAGLGWGYARKEGLAAWLKAWPWQRSIRRLRLAGLALVLAAAWMLFPGLASCAGLGVLFAILNFSGLSSSRLYAALCVIGALAAFLGRASAPAWEWP